MLKIALAAVGVTLAGVLVLAAQDDVEGLPAFEAVSIRETTTQSPWSLSARRIGSSGAT